MSKRETVRVPILSDAEPPETVEGVIEWLKGLLSDVPAEYRAAVAFEFNKYGSDYDTACGEISIYYDRPETDEEMNARIARENEAERARAEDRERADREALVALKHKYEGGPPPPPKPQPPPGTFLFPGCYFLVCSTAVGFKA